MADAAGKKPKKAPKSPKATGGRVELELIWADAVRPALISGVPALMLAAWCLCHWQSGPRLRHPFTAGDAHQLGLIVGGVILIAGVGGVLLPLAKWLCRYPVERFRSGSKFVWGLPLLLATPIWLFFFGLSIGCLVLSGTAIVHGLVSLGLLDRWQALCG